MVSGNIDKSPAEHGVAIDEEKPPLEQRSSSVVGSVSDVRDNTHRTLKSRHIQLIGIGGTIGTALYVQIGRGLMNGGPASLFLAFSLCEFVSPPKDIHYHLLERRANFDRVYRDLSCHSQ
jgi:amino acid transporter